MTADRLLSLCFSIGVIYTVIGVISTKVLDKLTRYKDDDITRLSDRHFNQFYFLSIFCLFFLDKIKSQRRITYHERRLLLLKLKYDRLFVYYDGSDSDELRECREKINIMDRILKIEKIKNRKN